jgi:hypothetical protein
VDGRVKPGHDSENVVVAAVGAIPLGSARNTVSASPTLNYSQFVISPFVNRRTTLHNRSVFPSRRRFQKA